MVGSNAIIGLPGEPFGRSNPGKYMLDSRTASGVVLRETDAQTLLDGSITQNATHTILTFEKWLSEPNEIEIFADLRRTNHFLVAAGASNDLGFHAVRGSVALIVPGLSQCDNFLASSKSLP